MTKQKGPQDNLERVRMPRRLPPHFMTYLAILAIAMIVLAGLTIPPLLTHAIKPSAAATTNDWPTFLHDIQRTSASTDTTFSNANVAQLVNNWSFKTGGIVASSPTVVAGTVYVASWDGYEYALDAITGAQKWKTFLGITNAAAICNPPTLGVSSAATVLNNVVYVGGGDAYWYALDAATGNVLWKTYTGDNSATGGHYNWSSPLIYNGFAYIGIASEGDCPLVQGQLLKVNLATHLTEQTLNFVPPGETGGGVWTTPSIDPATNTIYVSTGTENLTTQTYAQALVAIDANTLNVTSSWKLPEADAVLDSDFSNSPTLFMSSTGTPMLASINKNGYVYAFNRSNLAAGPLWKAKIAIGGDCPVPCGESSVSSGAFANGVLYLAGEDTIINGAGYKGSVNALNPDTGQFLWQHGTTGPVIGALAYANGLVIDGAGAVLEVLEASTGKRLASYATAGWLYAAPSVANGQIYIGGVDTHVYAFGLPATPPPPPPPDANCPGTWVCQDVGNPVPIGSEVVSNGTWTVKVGGAGIAGASDQFRLMTQIMNGDTQVVAKIVSQQTTATAAQAGLIARQNNTPGSPYYGVFLTRGKGIVVQYRTALGGTTTKDVQLPATVAPLYLEIQRVGDNFQAATSNDGITYTLVPGSNASVVMPNAILAGLAATSATNNTLDTVVYNKVAIGVPTTPPNPTRPPTPCPANWSCQDIGNPALVGDQSLNNGTWTLKGAGAGIAGYGDQFHSVWQSQTGDVALTAHIASQTNMSGNDLAGLMLRQSTATGAPYYGAFVTPGNSIRVQVRYPEGPNAVLITTANGAAPIYLQVARSGNNFSTYTSPDGVTWTYLPGTSITLNLPAKLLSGLAVTSSLVTAMGQAQFDTVTMSPHAPPPPTLCPNGWNCNDIGFPTPAGDQNYNAGTWTINAGGGDIWNTVDQFHYVSQPIVGDGNVSAHIVSQTNSDPFAKAGVMLRQNTTADAAFYAALVTPSNGILIQYRTTPSANAASVTSIAGTVPNYLKVDKVGTTFTAYTSLNGTDWTSVPDSNITLSMIGTVQGGIAVTSHNTAKISTVSFDTVTIGTSAGVCPTNWNCADIGATGLAGSQTVTGTTWTMQAAGGDIWGTSDQFHYIWQGLTADGSVSAHVASQTNTDPWAKAGVMLRQSTDPASLYYNVVVTPSNGIMVQYRATVGASATTAASIAGTVPQYVQVSRMGTTFMAYTSADGVTWTAIPGSSITLSITGTVLAGVAATSHNVGALSTVAFDSVNIGPSMNNCPANWNCEDIGNTGLAGSQVFNGGTWTMKGSGGDIWGTSDQFHYAWQPLAVDGSVSAHVVSQTNTNPWAKTGVMLRQSTDPASLYYDLVVTPSNGITVQYRATAGGAATSPATIAGTTPAYFKINRVGTTFTAFTSPNGTTWTAIPGSSVTLNMTGTIDAGIIDTSHDNGQLSTSVFDTVVIGAP